MTDSWQNEPTISPFIQSSHQHMLKESSDRSLNTQNKNQQSAPTLPNIEALVVFLAIRVLEVLAGTRPADHLASRVSDIVFRRLQLQAALARQQRELSHTAPSRPDICVRRVRIFPHGPYCRECLVILESSHRTRAVTMHIEHTNGRWQASSLSLL